MISKRALPSPSAKRQRRRATWRRGTAAWHTPTLRIHTTFRKSRHCRGALCSATRKVPPGLPKSPFPRPSPQGTLAASAYPILRSMSRPRFAVLHLAAAACWGRSGRMREGRLAAEACGRVAARKCRLNFLYMGEECHRFGALRHTKGDDALSSMPFMHWHCAQ